MKKLDENIVVILVVDVAVVVVVESGYLHVLLFLFFLLYQSCH